MQVIQHIIKQAQNCRNTLHLAFNKGRNAISSVSKTTIYNIYGRTLHSYIKHSHRLTYSGIFATLSLCLFTLATVFPLTSAEQYTEAATGTASNTSLTLTTASGASLDFTVNNSNGTFMETSAGSGQAEFSVTTNNYTGYTLTISASEGDTSGALVNSADEDTSTNSIASIGSATGEDKVPDTGISASTFNTTAYNGMWGYKPSKLNSEDNTNYLPAPTTTATTLNVTNCPNGTNPCSDASDTYTIDLAARLLYTQASGDYSKTFVLTAVGNQIDYAVSYTDESSTATDIPTNVDSKTDALYITLSSTTPTREGYTFKGWCTVSTGADGTGDCTGTDTTGNPAAIYQPGDQYPINQTTANNAELYAMWEKNMLAIQNLPDAQCTTTAADFKDIRDNQIYTVQRLADGKCWMMTNLNLGATTLVATQLDNTNTHITDGSTIAASTFNGWKQTSGTGTNTAAEYIPVSGTDSTNNMPYGTLYNYCAASAGTYCFAGGAGTGNATSDLCPKGWRLPTGGSSGEFQTLYGNSNYNTNAKMRNSIAAGGAAFTLSGYFSYSPTFHGSIGFFWSSTRDNGSNMYDLYLNGSDVSPAGSLDRYNGFSIRCVKQSDAEILQGVGTMQNVTPELVSSIADGTTATLTDSRDNQSYTVAKINGNLWMTRNLAIGCNGSNYSYGSSTNGKSLSSSDTNLATGATWITPTALLSNASSSTQEADYSNPRMQCDGSYGAWYNFAAASAGTVTGNTSADASEYDICPAGWRLPTRSEHQSITSAVSAYSPVSSSGRYVDGSRKVSERVSLRDDYADHSYWWASDGDSARARYILIYLSSKNTLNTMTYFKAASALYEGLSIRCIAKTT